MKHTEMEFDRHAKGYEANLDRYLKRISGTSALYVAEAKASRFIAIAKSGKKNLSSLRCLDVGCGTGLIASLILNEGIEVIGVDLSHQMIAPGSKHSNNAYQSLVSNSTALPFSPDSFDLAYSVCLFHHLDESSRLETLREMKRVTKPGGHVVIFEHNPYNPIAQITLRCCPLDRNAKLISLNHIKKLFTSVSLRPTQQEYILFFPQFLSRLKPIELKLGRVPFGAQYFAVGQKI